MKTSKEHSNIMFEIKEEIKKIYNIDLDRRVVDFAATHPFLFTAERMRDSKDDRPVRHRYLFIIAIKNNKKSNQVSTTVTTT